MNIVKKIIRPFALSSVRKLLRCFLVFGLYKGFNIYRRLDQLEGIIRIDVPGLPFPVEMRARTSDTEVFRKVFLNREYEIASFAPVQFIFDAGANIGLAAIDFANRFPMAKIIAIEPEASNFAMLQRNTRHYPNIIPIMAGLWPTSTYLHVRDPGYGKWGFMTEETNQQENTVKTVTLNELVSNSGFRDIDILKIDIEGAEKEVFERNYQDWIGRVGLFVIELHDRFKPGCSTTFYDAIAPLSLAISRKGENVFASKTK